MIERVATLSNAINWDYRGGSRHVYEDLFYVKTDEPYRVQRGDRTIEVIGDTDVIFDDVCEEGASFWILRSGRLYGYTFSNGDWIEVSGDKS